MSTDPAKVLGRVAGQHYRVVRWLGSGSMSAVYEVVDQRDGTGAAMKVLLPALGADPQIAARFEREAKAMSMFDHPNIVDLRDLGRFDDGTPFLITDLVRGVSLRDVLEDGIVDQHRALLLMRQVLDALAHAHARGVIHRDVKPENIMLADGGNPDGDGDLVQMLDFGVAKLLGDALSVLGERNLTQTGCNVIGTPLYIAPEPLLGRPIDARIDLYSAGVVLFELLAGKTPFSDPDPTALVRLHVTAPVPTLAQAAPERSFTPQLEYLVSEALAKQPEHRFKSATEMMGALDAAIASLEPIQQLPTPKHEDPIRPSVLAFPATYDRAPSEPAPAMPATAPPPQLAVTRIRHDAWRWLRDYREFSIVSGGLFLIIAIAIAAASGSDDSQETASISTSGPPVPAVAPELPTEPPSSSPRAGEYLEQAHADFKRGRRLDALGAYERAIALEPELATDLRLRKNVTAILDTHDSVAAVIALELLATRVQPPAREPIVAQASNGKVVDVRHRAFAIAERDGFVDQIDRTESWSLDLKQATTCEERKLAIAKLRIAADRRALVALRKTKTQFRCVEREAADAIAQLEIETRP